MRQLEDTDRLAFGAHNGKMLQDVPASYLHYLWQHGRKHAPSSDPLADYIRRNIPALKKEFPDGLWE